MQKINDKFVSITAFDYKMDELRSKVDENKEIQNQLNDAISDKFDVVFQKFEAITEEYVSKELLTQTLDGYAKF